MYILSSILALSEIFFAENDFLSLSRSLSINFEPSHSRCSFQIRIQFFFSRHDFHCLFFFHFAKQNVSFFFCVQLKYIHTETEYRLTLDKIKFMNFDIGLGVGVYRNSLYHYFCRESLVIDLY